MPTALHRRLALVLLGAAAPALAQAPADPHATVEKARSVLSEKYVLPDVATRLAEALAKGEAAGHYRGLTGEALAERMNADMAAVTPDKHLSIHYRPKDAAEIAAMPERKDDDSGPEPAEMLAAMARDNYGVREMKLLPGNIRYVAYDGFMWSRADNGAAIATAARFLKGADAYIIDLRRNGGGSPEAVAAWASYFIPAGTPLMRFEMRGAKGEETRAPAAPFTLAGKPLYVLTSGGTASAAEEFSTHVSALGFGTLVGARTAGAGFRNDIVALPGGYLMSVSVGRAVSLKTGHDWERVGITPAVETPVDGALARAEMEAAAKIVASAAPADRPMLDRVTAFYRAGATAARPAHTLAAYAGTYGDRTVAVDGTTLTIARGTRAPLPLTPLGGDRFALADAPTTIVAFDATGAQVTAMMLDTGDTPPVRHTRAN